MAEELVESVTEEVVTGEASAETENTERPQPEPEQPDEQSVPYSRFKEVNEERKSLKAQIDAIEKATKEAEIEAKKEEGKWKELYTDLQTKLAEERLANEQLRHDALRQRIAQEHGHAYLWDRLRGEDEEELVADLQSLITKMPAPKAPSTDGAAGGGARKPEATPMTEATKRELAAKLGIPAQYIDESYLS